MIIVLLLILIISIWTGTRMANRETSEASSNENKPPFTPTVLSAGNENQYSIDLEMNEQGIFQIDSTVTVKNTSDDQWNQVVFYFIPNMFTKENSYLETPSIVDITSIKVNGTSASFTLEEDTLTVPLETALLPENEVNIEVQYSFTLPEYGRRFTKSGDNYYLAQWYPMVATYRNGKWNKEEYLLYGESYHTSFSDFTFNYQIPKAYQIATSSGEDIHPSKNSGTLKANNVKEFFVTILNAPAMTEGEVDGINVRVFDVGKYEKHKEEILQIATDALQYFQQHIGEYPYEQLDIILDEIAMEYPGIITVGQIGSGKNRGANKLDVERLKSTVVHEIAHQWFYSAISNDPFYDGWLDESFAELTTALFFADLENKEYAPTVITLPNGENSLSRLTLPVNLPLNQYPAHGNSPYHYYKPLINLWNIFQEHGGQEKFNEFIKAYYETYQYKELNTQEFTRFLSYFLDLENNDPFKEWILLED